MALDSKLLGQAKAKLNKKRMINEAETERRTNEVCLKNPRVLEIDKELQALMAEAIQFALKKGDNISSTIGLIEKKSLAMQEERIDEILAMGLPADYLEEKYTCPDCRDTGYVGTEICSCLMSLYNEELRLSLSSLITGNGENFDRFKLNYYDSAPDPESGKSAQDYMEVVYEICVRYAMKFGGNSFNLYLYGAPGLGKTFLSACIANAVIDKGYSVVYDVAGNVFSVFEDYKFQKNDEYEVLRGDINRYLNCDLFIIDDLGTEMTTAFTLSVLYEIINSRLIAGKKTIINSNYAPNDFKGRYSEQIISRLNGDYKVLKFHGKDIRLVKNKNN